MLRIWLQFLFLIFAVKVPILAAGTTRMQECYEINEAVIAKHLEDYLWKNDLKELEKAILASPTIEIERQGRKIIVSNLENVQNQKVLKTLSYFAEQVEAPSIKKLFRSFWRKISRFLETNSSYTGVGLLIPRLLNGKHLDSSEIFSFRLLGFMLGGVGGIFVPVGMLSDGAIFSGLINSGVGGAAGAFLGPPEIIFRPFDALAKRKAVASEQEVMEAYYESVIRSAEARGEKGPIRIVIMRTSEFTNQAVDAEFVPKKEP